MTLWSENKPGEIAQRSPLILFSMPAGRYTAAPTPSPLFSIQNIASNHGVVFLIPSFAFEPQGDAGRTDDNNQRPPKYDVRQHLDMPA